MGEITEALRRARRDRESGQNPPREAPRSRADRPEPVRREAPAPVPAPTPPHPEVTIPSDRSGFWQARATLIDRIGPLAERWRQIALQVRQGLDDRGRNSLLVTSSLRAEGKTVTACNLALALATIAAGRRVALVDLDLRRPSVARGLEVHPEHGIEDVLAGRVALDGACVPTDVADLDVYPVLRPATDAHRLLSGDGLSEALRELEQTYALVVCDTPPVLPVPDVSLIAPQVGACLLVTRAGVTRRKAFTQMLTIVPRPKVIGTLLNDDKAARTGRYLYDDYRIESNDE